MPRPRQSPRPHRLTPPSLQRLGGLGALISRSSPRPRATRLDDGSYLVQPRGPGARRVKRIGPRRLRTDLLVDPRVLRDKDKMAAHQLALLHHVASDHIAWILDRMEVTCVLDVGANRGQFAKRLRRAGYRGRIVSFEPLPEVAEILEKAAADDPDWYVRRWGLGDVTDAMEMEVAGGQARMSSLRPPSDFGKSWTSKLGEMGSTQVSVVRLEEVFDELVEGIDDPRVYLKLDTQGYDLQAFAGAHGCLDRVVGMQSEVSALPIYEGVPRLTEQLTVYESAGFELTGMFPVIMDRPTMRVIEFDAVMIRVSALRT